MENEPLVTIAIPNYNYAHYLENCLNSLLNQTYSNFEVYFRDNQSTDDSLKIALGYKDKFAARGIYFNVSDNKRNLGSDINSELARRDAEGEYIYTLASDDAVKPEFLEKTMKVFEDHPEVYTGLNAKSDWFFGEMKNILEECGKNYQINHVGSIGSLFFTETPVVNYATAKTSDTKAFAEYFKYMLENGCHFAPSQFEAIFLSAIQTKEELSGVLDMFRAYMMRK